MQTSPAHSGARDHQAAGVGQELGQVDLGTATEMTDDFGSAQTAGLAPDGKQHNADQGIGEAAGVKIALPGGIDRLSLVLERDFVGQGRILDGLGERQVPAHRSTRAS
jgi:hypothetical protein